MDILDTRGFGNRSAVPNIVPFSYRDGITYQTMLYGLRDYINEHVIPGFNTEMARVYTEFITAMEGYENTLIETKGEWQSLFDAFILQVLQEVKSLNDRGVSELILDFRSETYNALENMIASRIKPLVRDQVADVIAEGSTIAAAATAAVKDAAEGEDFVTGGDFRINRNIYADSRWARVNTDAAGNVAGGFLKTGIFKTLRKPELEGDFITGDDSRSSIALSPDSKWAKANTDKYGNVKFGILKTGEVFIGDSLVTEGLLTSITVVGDSLVRGYTNGDIWDIADSFPAKLSEIMPGVDVANAGYGGNTVDDVRFRIGEKSIMVASVAGGSIPASGSVSVVVNQKFGLVESRENTYYGEFAGVTGNLIRSAAGAWSFTRSTPGDAVKISQPTPVKRSKLYPSGPRIIWVGRNDVSYNVKGNSGSVAEHVVSSIRDMVDSNLDKRFVIGTIMNRSDEPKGSERYNTIATINAALLELFPGKVMDMRYWFINQALGELKISPSTGDIAAVNGDYMPPSITDGGSHYTKVVSPKIAEKFKNYFVGMGAY